MTGLRPVGEELAVPTVGVARQVPRTRSQRTFFVEALDSAAERPTEQLVLVEALDVTLGLMRLPGLLARNSVRSFTPSFG